jgi:hypothetical protein
MRKLIASMTAIAGCLAGAALAQDTPVASNAVPRFVVLPPKPATAPVDPATQLPTWNGSFTYQGTTYNYYMVGTAPSTGTSTTIKAFLIPLKVVIGTHTFDPSAIQEGGESVTQQTLESPVFHNLNYTLGGTNIGTTQYLDAFQRANFWGTVKSHTGYHVLLGGPTMLAEQTLTPPPNLSGVGNPFGPLAGLVDINWFDGQLNAIIKRFTQIQPNTFPIFLTSNLYLTSGGGCCIGGYHSATGPQSYTHFTFITTPGVFSQDVSALTHEVGEWMDDPGTKGAFNSVACGILEVGDPEEGFANYGGFPYPLGGFNYNQQDLVFLEYFGALGTSAAPTSVGGWMTFHNNPFGLSVCSNGG